MADETSEPLSDNAALNEMVDTLESILLLEEGAFDSIEGSADFVAVGDTLTTLRAADASALKTIVSNGGDEAIQVFQDGVLTMIVPANDSRELPLSGQGQIKAKCGAGLDSLVAIATYKQTAQS